MPRRRRSRSGLGSSTEAHLARFQKARGEAERFHDKMTKAAVRGQCDDAMFFLDRGLRARGRLDAEAAHLPATLPSMAMDGALFTFNEYCVPRSEDYKRKQRRDAPYEQSRPRARRKTARQFGQPTRIVRHEELTQVGAQKWRDDDGVTYRKDPKAKMGRNYCIGGKAPRGTRGLCFRTLDDAVLRVQRTREPL